MNRLISILLVCLLCFYTSSTQVMAATEASAYEGIVNQLTYAMTGQLPSSETLANMASALAAANAPTNLEGLASAYNSNAGVRSLIDSIGNGQGTYSTGTPNFINNIFQNAFGHPANMSGVLYWANVIDAGVLTRGAAVLNILASASTAEITTFDNKITIAQTTVAQQQTYEAAQIAAKEAAEKAAKESAEKEAAEKAAKEAADKAAKEAAEKEAAEKSTSSGEGLVDKVKTFVHDHPVATAVIATAVVAGIVTAITVPICVHQRNVNRANNQQRTLNNQAIVTRLIQLANPTPTTVTTGGSTGGSSGGYQPPI
ncbi:MAG: DUF4214 domain-containing protein [Candidatus Obscuribacterales bacterium]|nr:DUF4214 domain-containing protein [Candidatus Obscuribacterales bacterium]